MVYHNNLLIFVNMKSMHTKEYLILIRLLYSLRVNAGITQNELAKKMGQIMVAVENYPQLKADQTMITAMQTYNEVEEHISAARRFYNSAVLELKNAVEIFPSSMFAAMLNIKSTDFFKAEEKERKAVNAADFLK